LISYTITYEPEALADLEKFSADVYRRIVNKIDWLGENFEQVKPQPLSSNLSGFFS